MIKKLCLILILTVLLPGSVFAQKHKSGDMLIGINMGLGITPNAVKISQSKMPKGNYAASIDLGGTFEYYIIPWLSVTSGLFLHQDLYQLLDRELDFDAEDNFSDNLLSPLCLTVPFSIHINIPHVEFLYLGAGVNLNFPVLSVTRSDLVGFDTKGNLFIGIPIDVGFDLIHPGKGGSRFFFRITPELHKKGTTIPIGIMWQFHNFKVR